MTKNEAPATKSDIARLGDKVEANSADIAKLDAKLDASVGRLDKKIDNVAMAVVRVQADVYKLLAFDPAIRNAVELLQCFSFRHLPVCCGTLRGRSSLRVLLPLQVSPSSPLRNTAADVAL